MPTATEYISRKQNVPSELRSKEWKDVQAQIRERAFFMASVANAKELHKWRSVMEQVTSGAMSPGQAREAMRRYLEKIGYSPDPGLADTIKDRSTVQRMKVSIDTNVAMARGWAARMEALDDVLSPGQELYRQRESRVKRNWAELWEKAARAVNWKGVARNGQMIALVTSPIWVKLSRFGTPYPPFDYGSGMRVRPVDFEVCEELGLVSLDDMDALEAEMQAQKESLNADVKASIEGLGEDLIDAVQNQLGGLVRRERTPDGDVLRMTDLNGTSPISSEDLADAFSKPVPQGVTIPQKKAVEDFTMDSRWFNGKKPRVGLDEKEDLARFFGRLIPKPTEEPLYRAMHWGTKEEMNDLRDIVRKNGFYTPLPDRVGESWSSSEHNTEHYATKEGDKYQAIFICRKSKTAKDLRPFYAAMKHKENLAHPLNLESEFIFMGGTRLKLLSVQRYDLPSGGKRDIYYVEEV